MLRKMNVKNGTDLCLKDIFCKDDLNYFGVYPRSRIITAVDEHQTNTDRKYRHFAREIKISASVSLEKVQEKKPSLSVH